MASRLPPDVETDAEPIEESGGDEGVRTDMGQVHREGSGRKETSEEQHSNHVEVNVSDVTNDDDLMTAIKQKIKHIEQEPSFPVPQNWNQCNSDKSSDLVSQDQSISSTKDSDEDKRVKSTVIEKSDEKKEYKTSLSFDPDSIKLTEGDYHDLPEYLNMEECDIFLITSEEEEEEGRHLQVLFSEVEYEPQTSKDKIRCSVYLLSDFLDANKLKNLEVAHRKCSLVFILLTKAFCEDDWAKFMKDETLMRCITCKDKKTVVPIFTQPRNNQDPEKAYEIPYGLTTYRGIDISKLIKEKGSILDLENLVDGDRYFLPPFKRMLQSRYPSKINREEMMLKAKEEWIYRKKYEKFIRTLSEDKARENRQASTDENLKRFYQSLKGSSSSPMFPDPQTGIPTPHYPPSGAQGLNQPGFVYPSNINQGFPWSPHLWPSMYPTHPPQHPGQYLPYNPAAYTQQHQIPGQGPGHVINYNFHNSSGIQIGSSNKMEQGAGYETFLQNEEAENAIADRYCSKEEQADIEQVIDPPKSKALINTKRQDDPSRQPPPLPDYEYNHPENVSKKTFENRPDIRGSRKSPVENMSPMYDPGDKLPAAKLVSDNAGSCTESMVSNPIDTTLPATSPHDHVDFTREYSPDDKPDPLQWLPGDNKSENEKSVIEDLENKVQSDTHRLIPDIDKQSTDEIPANNQDVGWETAKNDADNIAKQLGIDIRYSCRKEENIELSFIDQTLPKET